MTPESEKLVTLFLDACEAWLAHDYKRGIETLDNLHTAYVAQHKAGPKPDSVADRVFKLGAYLGGHLVRLAQEADMKARKRN